MKLMWVLLGVAWFSVAALAAECTSNQDCPAGFYCQKPEGECDGTGQITIRPSACPAIWDPVCGCDGKTYANACAAAAAGVSIMARGQCELATCADNRDCPEGTYCFKADGDCDGEGVPAERPTACPEVWDPVCGCDGQTYSNTCFAALFGVNVAYDGPCQKPCRSNADCAEGYYCYFVSCSDETGQSRPRPQVCPDIWLPVCGCDGQTYASSCVAAAAGVSVASEGMCPQGCQDSNECGEGQFCSKANGDCEGRGVCQKRPQACPKIYSPVCGCNDQTYANECMAAADGVSVAYPGECIPAGATVVLMDPNVAADDVHTGEAGLTRVRILWSEAVVFDGNDVFIEDEIGAYVPFTVGGSGSSLMTIHFEHPLQRDRYVIHIADSVYDLAAGLPIDGDGDGIASGEALIVMEHRQRADFNHNNTIDVDDLAHVADLWLAETPDGELIAP